MNNKLDIPTLLKALDNESNKNIMDQNYNEIQEMKINILKELELPIEKFNLFINSLKEYKFVNEIPDLNYGHYIRWISLKNPSNIKLTNGGIFCNIKINNSVSLLCKNNQNHFFEIKFDENLIFQKLTNQEKLLYLNFFNKSSLGISL